MKLKQADSAALKALTHRGRESVRVLRRARVLQLLAEGWTVVGVAEAVGVTETTVRTVRRRYREEGLSAALHEKLRPGAPPIDALEGMKNAPGEHRTQHHTAAERHPA
ncbi:helix-turn-helix domain-containing protein [Corallococcus exiguus]|uniref:helix-turn-helix domain-containing protein n=1 Tax=Corallococcus exiguus TaxID=83462 RepID=UPI003DA687D7